MIKKSLIKLCIPLMCVVAFTGCGKKKQADPDYLDLSTVQTTAYGVAELPTEQTNAFHDKYMKITIDGAEFSFPFAYSKLTNLFKIDWTTSEYTGYDVVEMAPHSYGNVAEFTLKDMKHLLPNFNARVGLVNRTDSSIKYEDADVYKFTLDVFGIDNRPEIDFNGLKWGANYDSIESVLGVPSSEFYNTNKKSTTYRYADEDGACLVTLVVYDDGGLQSVSFIDKTFESDWGK